MFYNEIKFGWNLQWNIIQQNNNGKYLWFHKVGDNHGEKIYSKQDGKCVSNLSRYDFQKFIWYFFLYSYQMEISIPFSTDDTLEINKRFA